MSEGISGATLAQALVQILVAFAAQVLPLLDALLLLAQLALQLLALELLVGRVAILLAVEGPLALTLLELAVEIALALLRLGERLGRRPARGNGDERHNQQGLAEQGAAIHHSF